jgi:hypothetical protein
MASLRMLLSVVTLSIAMLVWPPTTQAEPKSCAENMKTIYKEVESLDFLDYVTNKEKKASVSAKTQEYLKDTLPAFKAACPTEAKSIKDLENGNYLKTLAAIREKEKKALRHIKYSAGFTGGSGSNELPTE